MQTIGRVDPVFLFSRTSDLADQPDNALFFSAGPNEGHSGLFGTLTPVAAELTEGSDQDKRSRYEAARTDLQPLQVRVQQRGTASSLVSVRKEFLRRSTNTLK
jgi:hypothetical protein